jgi:hypothetical protein
MMHFYASSRELSKRGSFPRSFVTHCEGPPFSKGAQLICGKIVLHAKVGIIKMPCHFMKTKVGRVSNGGSMPSSNDFRRGTYVE